MTVATVTITVNNLSIPLIPGVQKADVATSPPITVVFEIQPRGAADGALLLQQALVANLNSINAYQRA